jgi:predicted Zn-dependent peptidase
LADGLPLKYKHLQGKLHETVYPSGMRWLHIDDEKAGSISLIFRMGVGSHQEVYPAKLFPEGTAHLLEHALIVDMSPETKNSFKEWNAFTTAESTSVQLILTPSQFMKGFDILSDLVYNFKPSEEMRREVDAVNSE